MTYFWPQKKPKVVQAGTAKFSVSAHESSIIYVRRQIPRQTGLRRSDSEGKPVSSTTTTNSEIFKALSMSLTSLLGFGFLGFSF